MAQEPETTTKRAELPMRLTRLRVKNFRSIADIDIPLSPLTVLVGPNGSGKSNVVDALRFVRDVFARGLDQAVMDREGMGVIQRWGKKNKEIEIALEVCLSELTNEKAVTKRIEYSFSFFEGQEGIINVSKEKLTVSTDDNTIPSLEISRIGNRISGRLGGGGFVNDVEESIMYMNASRSPGLLMPEALYASIDSAFYDENQSFTEEVELFSWEKLNHDFDAFEYLVKSQLFYTFNSSDLRQPQHSLREVPFEEKGKNLAAVLRHLTKVGGSDWNDLRFALHHVIAGFYDYEIESVGGYLATKFIYQVNDKQTRTSYLGQESDGTIRMLGLLAALYQEPSQPFICIEEPEANIHPGALAVLAGVIDEASLRSQILVTTYSPDMLDHLPIESFLVVEKVGDSTHVGPLDLSQIASVRKRLFTPGELFRMEGLQRQTEPKSAS